MEWEEEIKDITLSHSLSNDQPLPDARHITGISWNSTGSAIAASYVFSIVDRWLLMILL